jgi:hypothetical protein
MGPRFSIACALGLLVMALAPGCGNLNSIVDGTCATGYAECGGTCIDVRTAPDHCGECDNRCEPGLACVAGVCTVGGDSRDGSTDGAAGDGSTDGASTDGPSNDGTSDGAPIDGSTDGDPGACAPPFNTPQNCGACGVVCQPPNSECVEDTAGFECAPPCTPPLVRCGSRCVDLDNDPFNCGRCGKFCPSNLCSGGVCQGATPGDIVVIGHDYSGAIAGTSQARVLTNSVFIPTSNALRVLSYEELSNPTAVARVKSIIQAAAGGRVVNYTVGGTSAILEDPTLAAKFDVVLLYDQQSGNAATLAARGSAWAPHLSVFTKAGGVVVALDGSAGLGAMPALLVSAGLLDVAGHTPIAVGTRVGIVAPSDRVATSVASPYGSFARSVTFRSNEPNSGNVTYVAVEVSDGTSPAPVVVHKVVP